MTAPEAGDRRIDRSRRVRVTAPASSAARAPRTPPLAREVAEQSELGGVVLRSLLRSQFRLAALVAGAFLTAVAVLWVISEAAGDLPWLPGVPLVWLLVGALPYPAALVAAVAYYRAANRTEQRYAELLEDHP
ncbi:hypothetical protein SA2016_1614 [Sinomonas atrocyanea]|uniref:Uncharacterized protein n=1 Tax=Sinomonas atrocyanea TaxID=37927 RepID=A0A126ZYM9_9MICC|nr:hypothetical protein [Sinomonas atrocyanea]AMM32290.1 hypothetical protein SA2016_1614 [Sinomonas atrocyanea]GEB66338.1 hypothetical protein SAT01_37860 [Sinomonas atrocyanea]GGG77093.1 hypothetical protein GCM10007172_32550 [Sinomonas atrocyanea]